MKEFEPTNRGEQNLAIDRFVDGELSDQSERQLLAELDASTDGWRTLALAFVEARMFQKEFRSLVDADGFEKGEYDGGEYEDDRLDDNLRQPNGRDEATQTASRLPQNSMGKQPGISKTVFALALAASFLLAFGIAFVTRDARNSPGPGSQESVATEATAASSTNTAQTDRAQTDAAGASVPDGQQPRQIAIQPSADQTPRDRGTGGIVEEPPLEEPGDEIAEWNSQPAIEIPIITVGDRRTQASRFKRSALPDHIFDSLKRHGYRIESRKDYRTVELSDGRRIIIPIEQIDFDFKGTQSYQ